MKPVLFMFALVISSLNSFAAETSIRVPLINSKGKFIADSIPSLPKFLNFTSSTRSAVCDRAWNYSQKASSMLIAVGHPSDYALAGVPVCYSGDATAAMAIALNLGDCAFTDQFSIGRRYVKDEVIHIENASNDDGSDLKWSVIKKCK